MILLDTHAWVWWVSNPELLSRRARNAFNETMAAEAIYVSSMSAWEVAMLAAKGRLRLTTDVVSWIRKSEALPFISFAPVNNAIACGSVTLPESPPNDPADRIIISTALYLGARLITKDRKILNYGPAQAIW